MKNLFFPNVEEQERQRMLNLGIISVPLEIDGTAGVVADLDNIDKLLATLGLIITEEVATPLDGVFLAKTIPGTWNDFSWFRDIELQKLPRRMDYNNKGDISWNGNGNKAEFQKIANQILADLIGRPVVVTVPHGNTSSEHRDGSFWIKIYSSPCYAYGTAVQTPTHIWGIQTSVTSVSYPLSGQGIAIRDEDNDYAVAELVGDNLYIHHDICDAGTKNELAIFSRILQEVAKIYAETYQEGEVRSKIRPEVFFVSESCHRFSSIIQEILIASLKRHVIISRERGCSDVNFEPAFYVKLESSPLYEEMNSFMIRDSAFGIEADNEFKTFAPSGQGIIVYDEAGNPLAELVRGNNLYVLFDLFYAFNDEHTRSEIMRRLLSAAVQLLVPEEAEAQVLPASPTATTDKEIIRGTTKRLNEKVRQYKQVLRDAKSSFREMTNDMREQINAEWEHLISLPCFVKVISAGDCIQAETEMVYATDDRTGILHRIGKFFITIDLSGGAGFERMIMFQNLGPTPGDWQAPHVHPDGHACWGNMWPILQPFIEQHDYPRLLMLAVAFLESVNTSDSAGSDIKRYPVEKYPEKRRNR